MKKLFLLFCLVALTLGIKAQNQVTLRDVSRGTYRASNIYGIKPMLDGQYYTQISPDRKRIVKYSFKTGKQVEAIFDVEKARDCTLKYFDDYIMSPDEKLILIQTKTRSIYRRSFTAEYYIYNVKNNTIEPLSKNGPQQVPLFSPDGFQVAFVRNNNIFLVKLLFGNSESQITKDGEYNKVLNGIPDWVYEEEFGFNRAFDFSADSKMIAYIRFDESHVPVYSFDQYRSYCDEDPLGDMYPEAYSYKYPLAGYPNSTVEGFAYNLDNRTTKRMDIEIGSDYVPDFGFDGEGRQLMVTVLNRDQNNLRLYRVNPASTVARLVLTETSDAWLSPDAYQMRDYGKTSFIIGSERSGYRHLYEYDYNGNLLRSLTKGNWNVTNFYGRNPQTGIIYVQTTQNGAINRNVASVDRKGNVKMLNPQPGTENAFFSKNFEYYLRKYSNSQTPTQYTICNNTGKRMVDVELNEEYAAKYASAPKMEFLKVPNADGQEMDAYIVKPSGFDASKQYPLLMYQYNGPDSQQVLNAWRMEGIFYLASKGYVVACVDGRGTGNRDRKWSTCVYKDLGRLETADQLAGAKYFSNLPYVDASRTACFGWSFGGYMTLMELTSPDCKFKAGVAMAPVTDWRFYDSIYTERYMSTPQQNKAGYDASSTLARTDNLKSRLLIMSGTSDDNVHFYNTLKFASKLNYEGKVFDMMALAGFEHSLGMCNARAMLFNKILDFLDTNLK